MLKFPKPVLDMSKHCKSQQLDKAWTNVKYIVEILEILEIETIFKKFVKNTLSSKDPTPSHNEEHWVQPTSFHIKEKSRGGVYQNI